VLENTSKVHSKYRTIDLKELVSNRHEASLCKFIHYHIIPEFFHVFAIKSLASLAIMLKLCSFHNLEDTLKPLCTMSCAYKL